MLVFFRTIILYIFVIIALRIMGKGQIGELQPYELVVTIMLSELAAVPMQDTAIPLFDGIVPILTLMFLEIIISYLCLKFIGFRKVVSGVPSILIQKGKVDERELSKQRVNLDDLMEELRMKGYLNISEIEYAILEPNGTLSVIPKPETKPVTKLDMNLTSNPVFLPITIVLDGHIMKDNLKISGHDIKWLKSTLKTKNIRDIKNVFFAMFDSNGQLFIQERLNNEE